MTGPSVTRSTVVLAFLTLVFDWSDGSQKKGISIAFKNFQCDDFIPFEGLNWWYDWHLNPFYIDDVDYKPNCPGKNFSLYDSKHASMVWGWKDKNKVRILADTATVLMGFNEPNYYGQANLTPYEAAELWPQVEAIAGGRPLASPSASPCSNFTICSDMFLWFQQFYGNCSEMHEGGCRVDYTATHYYACNDDWLMGTLKQLYTRYGKKVWLTEFACPNPDPNVVQGFMAKVLPRLEKKDFVDRYSWYTSRIVGNKKYIKNSSSLLQENSSQLTDLGHYYVNYEYVP